MEIRKVEYKDEREPRERTELERTRCFFKKITWQRIHKEEEVGETSGITWIELFALYMRTGPGDPIREEEKTNPLRKKQSLQKRWQLSKCNVEE